MDLELTDEQRLIQETVRRFVDERVLPHAIENDQRHHLDVGVIEGMAELGLLGIVVPEDYGGAGLDFVSEALACEEIERGEAAFRTLISVHVGLNSLSLLRYGSEQQKQRYLVPQAKGDKLACFGLTEPGAGSDVAGLSTRAVRDGDQWVVNGQKVWTSFAHLAKWGLLVARSDPDQPKHRGLTYFIVDMKARGVEVRPLRQMTGDAEFNEVYFTDVRIPDSMRLGEVGYGWDVAVATLMNERVALGGGGGAGIETGAANPVEALMVLAGKLGRADDPVLRQKIAQLWIEAKVLRYTNQRSQANLKVGRMPGPEGSIGKLFQAEFNQRLQETVIETLGSYGMARFAKALRETSSGIPMREGAIVGAGHDADSAEVETADMIHAFLRSRANTIEGGTSEVMRNIIGERVLGLPKEPQVDRDVPWSQVRRSS